LGATQVGSQSLVDTSCLNYGFALLQWMIVGLSYQKDFLALADKGKSSWCFHVKKLLTDIDLGHLNPENFTHLSAKEFQSITIAKLIDKANRKWKV